MEEFADEDEAEVAQLRLYLARAVYGSSDYVATLALLEEVLEVAERRALMSLLASALMLRGNAFYTIGRRREAFGEAAVAEEIAAENDLTEPLLRVLGNLANASHRR